MSYINQVIILQCGPPSLHYCTLPKKAFLSPSVWARREYIWKLNWKESLLIYFENWQGAPCSHRQSGNRMMNTFITLLSTSKRPSLSLYLGTHLTEELLTDYCFVWKLPRYSLFLHRQSRQRMVNTLLMIKINPTCKRLLIFICQEKNRNLACITNKQVINC